MKRMKKSKGIVCIILMIAFIALMGWYSVSVLLNTTAGKDESVKLGLDLAGGVSITYGVVGGEATQEQINDTITKLQQRIENDLGEESSTTEASVYAVGNDRITVEIPGVKDANALLAELGTPGTLYFIQETDDEGNPYFSYMQGYGYFLTDSIEAIQEKGGIVATGLDVKTAQGGYQTNQTTGASEPIVHISFDDKGTQAFAEATTRAYQRGEAVAIYYDGAFVSVPHVNEPITGGTCQITGMSSYEEATSLASYIRIGGLDIELEELESQVVGAQLGSNALDTSLLAAAIGLLVVMLFLICMYRVPGLAASLALALYTALLVAILYWFDITLTLSGIAGMILSIGMAVDANVIVFARIREEIAAGRSVAGAIDNGYSKALSAIVDGNITTLIAAAVLGILGSGSVKGFAITLAIGVILSMFTALVITRIIMNALYAIGCKGEKLYGKAKELKEVNFIGKKHLFFAGSLAVIVAGFIAMGVFGVTSGKTLNYSLEFMGGTSTTVDMGKPYTIEQLDAQVRPVIASVAGNDIQTTTVDGSNQAIFKTKTLSVEERTALEVALKDSFGIENDSISSQNISSTISGEMRRQSIIAVIVAAFFMLLYIWFRFKDIRFAGSAIIALIHDVLVVLTVYAIARVSVGSAFIACMLTVIGYSVNDTIVIFDRIRENLASVKANAGREELAKVSNVSLSQTLSRSISTSITTAIMVLMLLILGVSTIREFAFPLLIGVICGTYSSICIATELWYVFKIKFTKSK